MKTEGTLYFSEKDSNNESWYFFGQKFPEIGVFSKIKSRHPNNKVAVKINADSELSYDIDGEEIDQTYYMFMHSYFASIKAKDIDDDDTNRMPDYDNHKDDTWDDEDFDEKEKEDPNKEYYMNVYTSDEEESDIPEYYSLVMSFFAGFYMILSDLKLDVLYIKFKNDKFIKKYFPDSPDIKKYIKHQGKYYVVQIRHSDSHDIYKNIKDKYITWDWKTRTSWKPEEYED